MPNPFEKPIVPNRPEASLQEGGVERMNILKTLERLGVDPGIRETVATLNLLGFPTTESCEGHVDHGNPAARVSIEAPNKPRWRFVGEEEAFQKAAAKYGVTVEEILENARSKYGEDTLPPPNEDTLFQAQIEAREQTPVNEETAAFKEWRTQTDALALQLETWLKEYYRTRTITDDTRLTLDNRNDDRPYRFTLHNGGAAYLEMADPEALAASSEEEKRERSLRQVECLKEMRNFTLFLKQQLKNSQV